MRYFSKFPFIDYTLTEYANTVPVAVTRNVPNMTTKLQLQSVGDERYAYTHYRVKDTDRPDTVAAQIYGSSRYTWVVLLSNDMRDWYDWPMTDAEFETYMDGKYETQEGLNDGSVASRETIQTYQQIVRTFADGTTENVDVDETAYDALDTGERTTITVYEYEKTLNDNKRLIKLPTPESLSVIEAQLNTALGT